MKLAVRISCIVLAWIASAIQDRCFAQFESEKSDPNFVVPHNTEHVDRDPLRPEEWYRDYRVKERAASINSIDYGAVPSPDPAPFWLGEPISRMAFSPDSKLLASGTYSGPIWILNSETGRLITKLRGHGKWVSAITFTPDSKQLISASGDGTMRVWDLGKQQQVKQLEALRDTPLEIVVHPDGKEIFWRASNTIVQRWNIETDKRRVFLPRERLLRSLALAVSENHVAVGGEDGVAYTWQLDRGVDLREPVSVSARHMALVYDADGRLKSASFEEREDVFQLGLRRDHGAGAPVRMERVGNRIGHVQFSRSGTVLAHAYSSSGECKLWDGEGKRGVVSIPCGCDGGIALSSDGKQIATCDDAGAIFVRNTQTGRRISAYPLQTFLRPLVHRIRPGDPVRVALHWSYPNQPFDSYAKWPVKRRLATFESLVFHMTDADNVKRELSLREVVSRNRTHWDRPWSYDPTLVMEFTADGLAVVPDGVAAKWRSTRTPDFTSPGTYKLWIEGVIRFDEDTDVPFETGEVKWEISQRDMVAEDKLVAIAEKKLREVIEPAALARLRPSTQEQAELFLVDDNEHNRRVRFVAHGGLWSYSRYDVTCSPQGEVVAVHRDEVFTCIAAGTKISTPSGDVPVETVEPGMEVWGFDLREARKVPVKVRLVTHHPAELTLRFGELRVTPEHPIFANGKWRSAGKLRGGETIVDVGGRSKPLAAPEKIHGAVAVYDITVDKPNNYFAGGVLVHNKSREYSPHLDDPWYQLWPQWRREFKQIWPAKEDSGQKDK